MNDPNLTSLENSRSVLEEVSVDDIRIDFPALGPGSDAHNPHTTYSNPYVVVRDSDGCCGHGIGFTLGMGNEHVCQAIRELFPILANQTIGDLFGDFRSFWRRLANPPQRRWLGPYCGIYYMAAGALANAFFDLVSKKQGVPLWDLLCALSPAQTTRLIDFRFVEHLMDEQEAIKILKDNLPGKTQRKDKLKTEGLPCYFTTWIGSSSEDLGIQIENEIRLRGIHHFKIKVGRQLEEDLAKLGWLRSHFGNRIELYADANQVWSPPQAIEWIRHISQFGIRWIEEPTAPDSVDGHRFIKNQVRSLGVDVVTGENCPNSHVAAHFISSGSVDRFQIDACRVLGPAENLLIMLLAKKFGVPVCPHAGGSGLDELVPHLSAWNEVAIGAGSSAAMTEHVAICSKYFVNPSLVLAGRLQLPTQPGYLVGMTSEALLTYKFPGGQDWRT